MSQRRRKQSMNTIRQGDVLFVRVNELPDGAQTQARRNERIVIAEGEATGHTHVIETDGAVQYRHPALKQQWIVVKSAPVTVIHEEHQPVTLTPGIWMVPFQVNVDRGVVRRVLD
jgi:hypothetical protein